MRQVRAYREVRVTCARNAASFSLGRGLGESRCGCGGAGETFVSLQSILDGSQDSHRQTDLS